MNDRRPMDTGSIDVSVVLPAHNEEGNVLPLMDQFGELARKARFSLEVVLVDDGSTDQTLPRAVEAQGQHRFLRIVALPHRRGLTEALRAGFTAARGQIIVFYPADRQFHPADIPRMIEKVRSGFDLVTGRKIGFYNKKFVSSFYNNLSRWLFPSIKVSDLNSVKAFRRELVDVFDYRHDWHRFWVAIAAEAGYRIGEVDVTLYQRGSGRSKFGFWRIPGGVLDLVAVKFQYHTMRRPLWYFGMTGLILLLAAFFVGAFAVYQRFVEGHGYRPLVYLVMLLGTGGFVFFAIGFLAEAVAGVRQQLEMLKPGPKHHVHKPGAPDGSGQRRPEHRPDRRPDQRSDSRESGQQRRRDHDRPRREQPPRREEQRRVDPSPIIRPIQTVLESPVPVPDADRAGNAEPVLDEPTQREMRESESQVTARDEDESVPSETDSRRGQSSESNDIESPMSSDDQSPEARPNLYGRRKRT